jgi:hypothetical protein
MDKLQSELLEAAVSRYGEVLPTASRASLQDCFTEENSCVIFWFNDGRGNTRALVRRRPGPA